MVLVIYTAYWALVDEARMTVVPMRALSSLRSGDGHTGGAITVLRDFVAVRPPKMLG